MHEPIEAQYQTLKQKLLGHYGYYGITGNFYSLQEFLEKSTRDVEPAAVAVMPRRRLYRGANSCDWKNDTGSRRREWFTASMSSAMSHNDEEPDAFNVHVRICGGPGWEYHPGLPGPSMLPTPRHPRSDPLDTRFSPFLAKKLGKGGSLAV